MCILDFYRLLLHRENTAAIRFENDIKAWKAGEPKTEMVQCCSVIANNYFSYSLVKLCRDKSRELLALKLIE